LSYTVYSCTQKPNENAETYSISMQFSFLQVTLKLDPETEIKKFGPKPGPLDEIEVFCYID